MGHIATDLTAALLNAPPMAAQYRPVFWEPVAGTGERVVGMVALEPDAASAVLLAPATHVVIPPERLRAMLGRQRGGAAVGILAKAADFITARQQAGLPLDEIQAPFQGFAPGPVMRGRGYSVEQLLNSAVRLCSAFGVPDVLLEDAEPRPARHTVRTSEFIGQLKRRAAGDDPDIRARFEQTLQPRQDLPALTVDYAHHQWVVQITSLPSTDRQSDNTQREAQSKLFEIDQIRRHMQGNLLSPALLVNDDALADPLSDQAARIARAMMERLTQLAAANDLRLMRASTPALAAEMLERL